MQAKVYGVPGERVRTAGILKVLLPVLAAVLVLGIVAGMGVALLPLPKVTAAVFGILTLVAAAFLAWAAHLCPQRVDAFFKGARGEERAAFALEALPAGFSVFNGIARKKGMALMRGDMDHVVAGRTGVFVIETKNWDGEVACDHGRVWVDGRLPSRDPLAQVLKARDALEAELAGAIEDAPVKARPVLCFAGRGFLGKRANVDGVEICHAREVAALIGESPVELSADEVERVANRLVGML